jgi:ribosome-associated protein
MVHVFIPVTREYYNLENLWADALVTEIPDIL